MFSLSICFGPVGTTWALLFKTEAAATSAMQALNQSPHVPTVTDDFGQTFYSAAIHGMVLENMSESKLAHQERALHEGRIRVAVQQAAQSDPQLRAASMGQGPNIIQPGGMMGGRR